MREKKGKFKIAHIKLVRTPKRSGETVENITSHHRLRVFAEGVSKLPGNHHVYHQITN